MLEIYRTMSRYNQWMNGQLLTACAALTDEERKRPMGTPFGSIHGVWNHLLVADRIWMARFEKNSLPYDSLSTEVCSDFEKLCQERRLTDAAIETFVSTLTADQLTGTLTFTPISNPVPRSLPYYVVISHLFNHQTHHRGQITALLEQLGGDCGVTDLAAMPGVEITN